MWVRLDSDCGYEVSEGFEFGVDGWLFVVVGSSFARISAMSFEELVTGVMVCLEVQQQLWW